VPDIHKSSVHPILKFVNYTSGCANRLNVTKCLTHVNGIAVGINSSRAYVGMTKILH
jgi:hypothetical protein